MKSAMKFRTTTESRDGERESPALIAKDQPKSLIKRTFLKTIAEGADAFVIDESAARPLCAADLLSCFCNKSDPIRQTVRHLRIDQESRMASMSRRRADMRSCG